MNYVSVWGEHAVSEWVWVFRVESQCLTKHTGCSAHVYLCLCLCVHTVCEGCEASTKHTQLGAHNAAPEITSYQLAPHPSSYLTLLTRCARTQTKTSTKGGARQGKGCVCVCVCVCAYVHAFLCNKQCLLCIINSTAFLSPPPSFKLKDVDV